MSRFSIGVLVTAALLAPASAHAFCGFYVAGAEREMFNDATMVVMMREGTRTILSMQNDYEGPPEDFAMVIPVPVVLSEDDVRTLDAAIFERVDRLAAPRLVEYWEQDPCPSGTIGLGNLGAIGHGGGGGTGAGYGRGAGGPPPEVEVEAEFAVGEYDIVILSATDSSALDAWLRDNGYHIPQGADAALRPYVASGMKFFVAKVDVDRVTFESGRARLSPLRFHYDSDEFFLPVRLGLLSSAGTQDLIVHILARNQRYELANYPNVFIPTNLDVREAARGQFGEYYAALFDATLEANEGAVVTEYAWQATGCDPCPGPVLSEQDLATLGADVAPPTRDTPPDPPGMFGWGSRRVPTTRIRQPELSVEGAMPTEVVRRVMRRHINELRFCHEIELANSPGLSGDIAFNAEIDASGAVSSVSSSTKARRSATTAPRSACETRCVDGAFPHPRTAR